MEQKPDTGNAHVRKSSSKRESPDMKADEARQLLEDPAFIRATAAVEEALIREIKRLKPDGTPTVRITEQACCAALRALDSVKRALAVATQGQKLRLADFQTNKEAE